MSVIETQELKPRKLPLYIFSLFIIILFFFLFKDSPLTSVKIYFITGIVLFFGFFYIVLSKTSVVINNDGINFRLPFRKNKSILWTDISYSKIDWIPFGSTAAPLWFFFYEINKRHAFQLSYYSRSSLRKIAVA